jgi:phenylalanyl-tRNA synthetase beta chain
MKVTLNWLKEYVEFDWSPEELADRLTLIGMEVEGIEKLGGAFEGVVVAAVLSSEKHPNADKLSVCKVADGKGERQIVCGAVNYKVGDKVPLALPGATLTAAPNQPPFTIKTGRIRGVESQGMMCSPNELGLAEESDGLMILPPEAPVGQPFAEFLGRAGSDVVYDLEITPNRPDLNSVIGIAREISAATGNTLRFPEVSLEESDAAVETFVRVQIEDPELCPRYTARVIRGATIAPSPDWLRSTLEKVGIRSINNVVDVTNYVMLEVGEPLHAFDYHLLSRRDPQSLPAIIVRRAAEGEKFVTLDGQQRTLSAEMLLIADESRGIALAGIMGGQNTEINLQTKDVLIESACFKPQNIRFTSRKLDLRTDSSYRFERGADIQIADWASRRAAQLILQTAGGRLAKGVVDAYPAGFEPKEITLRHTKVDQLLGVKIPPSENIRFLRRLGLGVVRDSGEETCTVRVPSFRVDLKRETDLIEEICRLHGVDEIPATTPRGASGRNPFDAVYDELGEARRILTGLGLNEAQGQTLISDAAAQLAAAGEPVFLANPLSSDMNVLRPSLLPGLLDALRHNLHHKNPDVGLFEIGRVFLQGKETPREERRLAIALTGHRHSLFWSGEHREARLDIYDLKGAVEAFFEHFGLRGLTYARREERAALYAESATVHVGKFTLGELGQLSPLLARQYDLRDAVLLAELNLDLLLARRSPVKAFKSLPAFPSIRRDVALLVPKAVTHETVVNAVRRAKPQNLENVELFDIFRGKTLPEGQKSLAYAFTYRSVERTLTDVEVNAAHEKLVEHLKRELNATVR